jgi:ribosomal-protein-alanine N-acetyltransferase
LRPYEPVDAKALYELVNDPKITDTTTLPYPYPEHLASEWISTHAELRSEDKNYIFAVTLKPQLNLIGTVSLFDIQRKASRAEIGYWIGASFWGNGYATEAAEAIVAYGFEVLGLNRVGAGCLKRNPASAKVLEKAGFQCEGCLRQYREKNGVLEDFEIFSILRSDTSFTHIHRL